MLQKTTHPLRCDARGLGLLLALQPLALILGTNTAQADPLSPVYEHTIGIPAGTATTACVKVADRGEQCSEVAGDKVTFRIAATEKNVSVGRGDPVTSTDCTLMAETILLTLGPEAETESHVVVTMDGTNPPIEETITATPGRAVTCLG